MKGGNIPRTITGSDIYHKCGEVRHFMRDYSMAKAENKEYQIPGDGKDKRRYIVLEKRQEKLQLTTS